MTTYINIQNNLPAELAVKTEVNHNLSGRDWKVNSSNASSNQTTRILQMNREEGIQDHDTWVFTTTFTYAGVEIQLQEQLTGTLLASRLQIQIIAGDRNTGWQSANTTLGFTGTDGVGYRINGGFFLDGVFDDVTYTIGRATLPQINHVVVLMLENRSLDSLLGWLYGPDNPPLNNIPPQSPPAYDGLLPKTFSNQLVDGKPVYATEGTQSTFSPTPDPGEAFDQMTAQIFGNSPTADMSGFLQNYAPLAFNAGTNPAQIMQSYSSAQIPVLSQIAQAFALSDTWFASAPCQTWPNRGFVHTGSSDGHINNDDGEPYDINTIFNLLEEQRVSWMVYNNSLAPALAHLMFPKVWPLEDHFADMDAFYALCQQPARATRKLPQYTFIEPSFLEPESYHPPHDIRPSEIFLAQVYNALQVCAYRDEILFIITFDEHGGCYDHVPPPCNAAPPLPGQVSRDGSFDFSRFGVRVPTIVVSSYVTPSTVFRIPPGDKAPTPSEDAVPYDHTSILATLRDWLGIDPATFSAVLPSPRISAAPTLASTLTALEARDWPVVEPPVTEAQAVDLNEPPNELVMSLVIAEASRRAGKYVGPGGVAALKEEIRTIQHARAFFAVRPAKKK